MGKDNLLIDSIRNGDSNLAIKILSKNKKTSKCCFNFFFCFKNNNLNGDFYIRTV